MLEIGFSAYLTKPVRQSDLRDGIAAVLAGEKVAQENRQLITRHSVREERRDNVLVLLADDNVTNQQVAVGMLRKLGICAEVVANGAEAVRALETASYDLVFMDVQMPVMNGYEATQAIRGTNSSVCNHAVPIIAMTAHAMQGARDKCLEAGMNDYVSKPVSSQALADVLSRWLPSFPGGGARAEASHDGKALKAKVLSSECPAFDRAALLNRLMHDEELARTVLEGFMEDLPKQIGGLEELLVASDVTGVQHRAHTIKGASASVGGEALRMAAAEMEQMARDGDLENMRRLLPELKERAAGLTRAMRESNGRVHLVESERR
jgi:CheY-like chemotaxis protein/HPt (histidine-containing phosphotransfer) domain-containing protein